MDDYERDEYRKLKLLIEAAQLNKATTGGQKIRIETVGHGPNMSVTIEAYVLAKFIIKGR